MQLWPVPFMRPATVRHFFPDAKVDTYTDALRVALGACALDPQARQVAIAHQFVTAQGSTTKRSDSEVFLWVVSTMSMSMCLTRLTT